MRKENKTKSWDWKSRDTDTVVKIMLQCNDLVVLHSAPRQPIQSVCL